MRGSVTAGRARRADNIYHLLFLVHAHLRTNPLSTELSFQQGGQNNSVLLPCPSSRLHHTTTHAQVCNGRQLSASRSVRFDSAAAFIAVPIHVDNQAKRPARRQQRQAWEKLGLASTTKIRGRRQGYNRTPLLYIASVTNILYDRNTMLNPPC